MIDFSKDAIFNLRAIDIKHVNKHVPDLLIDGEEILGVFKTVRDQVVFTDKRIIAIDVQGATGTRQEFSVLPYANIQYFGIQTPAFGEIISDGELVLYFSNGFKTTFEFKGSSDILEIGRVISIYALEK